MSRDEAILARLRRKPPDAPFSEIRRLLEMHGWTLANQRGSHMTYRKAGELPLVVIVDGRIVRRAYIIRVLERLGLD